MPETLTKVALITGAANGIGLSLTKVYLQQGVQVVMVDKDEAKLNHESDQLIQHYPTQVHIFCCDVTKATETTELARLVCSRLGRIDWIYNNAGIIGPLAPVWELNPEQIKQVMAVNLYGMIHIIQAFMPYLVNQGKGAHIINMASMYGLCSGSQMAAYSMSKHAVLALSESLYYDLTRLEKPIDVSVVFPSFTDTGLLSNPSSENSSAFQESLNQLLAHSRPAMDIALHIIQEVDNKTFYILPDKEVKGYCEERTAAIIGQTPPHINNIEKLMNSLIKRAGRKSTS